MSALTHALVTAGVAAGEWRFPCTADGAARQVSARSQHRLTMLRGADRLFEHIGLEGGQPGCRAYNEPAFRHFLSIERKRSDRAGRSLLLMLVSLRPQGKEPERFPPDAAGRVFAGLAFCVREVDFVGWYREGRVAAAVLTQGTRTPDPEIVHAIGMRVSDALEQRLPWGLAARLDVRVLQLRPSAKE